MNEKIYIFDGVTITEGVVLKGTDTGLSSAVLVDEDCFGCGPKTKRRVVSKDYVYGKKETLITAIEEHISFLNNKLKEIAGV